MYYVERKDNEILVHGPHGKTIVLDANSYSVVVRQNPLYEYAEEAVEWGVTSNQCDDFLIDLWSTRWHVVLEREGTRKKERYASVVAVSSRE